MKKVIIASIIFIGAVCAAFWHETRERILRIGLYDSIVESVG